MTVIAIRDGVLAVDSHIGSNWRMGNVQKSRRLPDGSVAAGTGNFHVIVAFLSAMEAGGDLPALGGDEVIQMMPDGSVRYWDSGEAHFEIDAPYHAIGSGAQLAIGAMAMGATAVEAVEVACRYSNTCGLPVVWHMAGEST